MTGLDPVIFLHAHQMMPASSAGMMMSRKISSVLFGNYNDQFQIGLDNKFNNDPHLTLKRSLF
jgi:hypothetical protein